MHNRINNSVVLGTPVQTWHEKQEDVGYNALMQKGSVIQGLIGSKQQIC